MTSSGDQRGERKCADEAADVIFLAQLSDGMRHSTDANELLLQGAQAIGRYLGLKRCAFTEVHESEGKFVIYPDYREPNELRSAAGSYALSSYPSGLIEALKNGRVLSISDTSIDTRTAICENARVLERHKGGESFLDRMPLFCRHRFLHIGPLADSR